MSLFIILIPIFTAYLVLLSAFKFKKALNPVSILIVWWAFWLWLANFSLTGLFVPSARTQVMVLVMLGAISLGSLLAFPKRRDPESAGRANELFMLNSRRLFWLNVVFFPVMAFLLYRAIPVILTTDAVRYRADVYGVLGQPSPVFGGGYLQFLFFSIISPIVFFSLIVGIMGFLKFKTKKLLVVSVSLVVMEGIMTLGRFNFYYIVVFFPLVFLFLRQEKADVLQRQRQPKEKATRVKFKAINFAFIAAAGLAVLLALSLVRGEANLGPVATLEKVAIDYHTVGFVLFDQEINTPSSLLNTKIAYGRSSIGGLENIGIVFLRRFNPELVPIAGEISAETIQNHEVGRRPSGEPIYANAFYTALYSLYLDGRYVAVILLPMVFGLFVGRNYLNWRENGTLFSLAALMILMFAGICSLFQSQVEGMKFWVALFLVPMLSRFSLAFLKPERGETDGHGGR